MNRILHLQKKVMKYVLIFTLSIVLFSCSENINRSASNYIKIQGFTQGTTYSVVYKDSLSRDLKLEIDSLLSLIDLSVSTYIDSSLITLFNHNTDTDVWFDLDNIFYQNVRLSKIVNKQSSKAFDPTVAPLYSYFKFDEEGLKSIDSTKVDSILTASVGLDFIEISENKKQIRKLKPSITLNFNAIAQGYTVDFVADNLNKMGITDFMVEIGGEILAKGVNPDGKWWRIGIDKPTEHSKPGEEFQKIVELNNKALATSGNYRKFYIIDGEKYAHSINPITGFPVQHNLLSVSVLANTCAEADAYATAFMVLGKDKSIQIIDSLHLPVSAFFISSEGDTLVEDYSREF